ncbi:MFS transporter [Alloiococcus sp. CFN-8]|uniref:MFS transporter n=1 Tax=Alloiococcus sp. CFN-8 TaxID=3416081 RepID=UPI003CF800D4
MKQKISTRFPGALIILFIMMILSGITENSKGIFIPGFKEYFIIGDKEISYMLMGTSLTYMIANFFGGYLCEKIGQKIVLILGVITLMVSLVMMSISQSFLAFAIWIGINSAGLGFAGISGNTLLPVIVLSFQSLAMNLMHFFYGFGSTLGQRSFGFFLDKGISWRQLYLIVAVIIGILFLILFFIPFPEVKEKKDEKKLSIKEIFKNKLIILYMIALGTYVAAEICTSNWLVNYLVEAYSQSENDASVYLSTFFLIFALGRLFGGFVVERFGSFKTVIASLMIALILFTAGLLLGEGALFLIALSGLFFAITFPTVISTIPKVFPISSAYITGILVTTASFQSMLLNYAFGLANDYFGAEKAIFLIPGVLTVSIIFNIIIFKKTKPLLANKH